MTLNRRKLLCLACGSTGLAVIGAGCGSPTGSAPTGPVSAGNVSDLAVGSLLVMSNVVVARDENGLYGMSSVLRTPAACSATGAGPSRLAWLCPCHASTFDGAGNVTRGPAGAPLQHYQVTIAADGAITVDGSQPVSASTRTSVG